MLFSSYSFLFGFLPASLLGAWVAGRYWGVRGTVLAMVAASLAFYAAWDAALLLLLGASVGGNFVAGLTISDAVRRGAERRAGRLLAVAVTLNLAALGWFKYSGFLAASLNGALGTLLPVPVQILPLGLSFFTFEQIGYLVDVRRGALAETKLERYALFVSFFPRLVAGPILRYHEIMPQIPRGGRFGAGPIDIAVGLTLLAMGLAKKTLLADGVGPYAGQVFAAARDGTALDLFAAWGGVLAYTMQIYFDFSGYSDIAIGTARLFGIRFPANFNSPYQSGSIIEFWRRWHMTLSRFLRDYLYVPLGGNRHGQARRGVNLMLTMLLGGLWHGANWTFVAWGGLHGCYLIVNHAWTGLRGRVTAVDAAARSRTGRLTGWALTMLAVVVAWVFFRASSFAAAGRLLGAMAGTDGATLPAGIVDALPWLRGWLGAAGIGVSDGSGTRLITMWMWVVALGFVAFLLPNSQAILADWDPVLTNRPVPRPRPAWLRWQPTRGWAVAMATVALAGLLAVTRGGEFLYWQF